MTDRAILEMWTVYHGPRDYPGQYVARKFLIIGGRGEPVPTDDMFVAQTLEEIRELLPPGLYNLGRQDGDQPQIVESWV
jgi:hypothetical protein